MDITIVKTNMKPTTGTGKAIRNVVAFIAVVAVSVGVGFGVGWSVKPQLAIAPQAMPPAPASTPASTPATTPASKPASDRPSFLLFGDSLTKYGGLPGGWVTRLEKTYTTNVSVLNRGRVGFNTKQTLHTVLPTVLQEFNSSAPPVLITLWLGANDAALANGPNAAQHIDIDEYKTNLDTMISQLRDFAPLAKILLISPPVVDDAARRQNLLDDGKPGDPLDRSNEQTGLYAAACREVASAVAATPQQVTLLDMHTYLMEAYPVVSERAALFDGGLHFNVQGNAVVFEQVKKQIEALLPASLLGA